MAIPIGIHGIAVIAEESRAAVAGWCPMRGPLSCAQRALRRVVVVVVVDKLEAAVRGRLRTPIVLDGGSFYPLRVGQHIGDPTGRTRHNINIQTRMHPQ